MERRALITGLFNRKTKEKTNESKVSMAPSLAPYQGEWTFGAAGHLLRRTTFGPTYSAIKQAVAQGLEATIEQLFTEQPLPPLPINYSFQDDPTTPVGETWVFKAHDRTIMNLNTSRKASLNAWQMGLFNEGGVSIREKLVLFWHNHFVTSDIELAAYNFNYLDTLRRNALGNFRTFTEEITVAPSMLRYLNGNENTREAPNENYARELLELFTIGKGNTAGPGDSTTFTEDDVIALAKSLTGWQSRDNEGVVSGVYRNNRHDTSDKQLSHRFDNAVITNGGAEEYKQVIDIILQQEETARYLCRRLHIWFVGADINDDVEVNIIEPMAALIRENNYEIKPALSALLSSEYFYETTIRGCMVNHPIDFLFKMVNTFEIVFPNNIERKYRAWLEIHRAAQDLDMTILVHPSVAGWKAFHQAPQFYDVWANSVSLPQREKIINTLLDGLSTGAQRTIQIDTLAVISKLENPLEPNDLIIDLANTLFPNPISQGQIEFLKEILIPGLPDYEWTVEYAEYLEDPDNQDKRIGVENKLKALLGTMLKMPENYLI